MADFQFRVVDPRGWTITCTQEQWQAHVVARHPIMAGREGEARACIEHPNEGIFQDARRVSRQVYYRLRDDGRLYTKVVIEIVGDKQARVVTAFPTSAGKKGETQIWPESSD
jgi:hypothetical protein